MRSDQGDNCDGDGEYASVLCLAEFLFTVLQFVRNQISPTLTTSQALSGGGGDSGAGTCRGGIQLQRSLPPSLPRRPPLPALPLPLYRRSRPRPTACPLPRWRRPRPAVDACSKNASGRQRKRQNHVAESPSGRTQVETPVSYLSKLLGTTTLKEPAASSSSPPTPPSKPTVLVNKPHGWYFSIFIRTDLSGSFHTYPHLGGPFKSLQEVETAIECYIEAKRHKTLWDEEAELDMVVRKALYWPDGTTRKCSDEYVVEHTRQQKSLMLQALLDKYNEDHNLFGDLAYELNNMLHYGTICEDLTWYKHFNFIAKAKDGVEDLFFAEVTSKHEGRELVANSFCKIKSNENGHCYGCKNNGNIDMKHPDKADEYIGGHLDTYLPFSRRSRPNTWTGSKED
ncbi:hypothetical protein BRADI_4g21838v3 [Brachypodium distachyon]|uniref:DUF3615 domain-containing protein n=1 Tax=Brachypodium distachyon TaxID=15368 RepID=A0A2K2CPA1_BRADI|nr:hypothetical protein BRADI_4g21838v3 [Brachypodium distachyon]